MSQTGGFHGKARSELYQAFQEKVGLKRSMIKAIFGDVIFSNPFLNAMNLLYIYDLFWHHVLV